jgi:hypothetical protein
MRAAIRHPAILLLLALSLVPAALLGINGPWFGGGSGPSLRPPAAFPQNLSPHTFRRISAWFNDRLGMRYPLMVLDSHWRLRVWQLRFRGDVLFGKWPWLFFNDNPPEPAARSTDLRGELRMAQADIATLDRQMAAVQTQLGPCGKIALLVVVPNKQSIYPEQLRDGEDYRRSRLDDVIARLGQGRSLFIDPRPELRADKSRHGVPLYYQTDSHWNDLGAFIAYQKIVSTLTKANAIERSDLASLDGVSVDTEPFAGGDVATRILYLPWNFADRRVVLRGTAQIPLVVHSERNRLVIANARGKGKLVMMADSFGPPLAALLARHFSEVEMLSRPTWPATFDGALIAQRKADVAMIEIAERSLPEILQPPHDLARACEPGAEPERR